MSSWFARAVLSRIPALPPSGKARPWLLFAACVAVFVSRVLFLPPTLEDIDSMNFALALDHYDPSLHQPHPPGYPVYTAIARLVHTFIPDPATALSALSALSQGLLVVPLVSLFGRLGSPPGRAALGALLTLVCPILWFNGARPMSDSLGLLFVVSTQALLLRSLATGTLLPLASLLTGLSLGVRLQVGLLTIPLWLWTATRTRRVSKSLAPLTLGIMLWAVPMVIETGGPVEYGRAFSETMRAAAEFEPLTVGFTLNRAARALFHIGLDPWFSPGLGLGVTALATIGLIAAAIRRRAALGLASLAFLPYFLFHSLFQEAETIRYSLPYVPWIAWLAIEGLAVLARRLPSPRLVVGVACAILVILSTGYTIPALGLYHLTPSPPYSALHAIKAHAVPATDFVLSGHYMFRRYFPQGPAGVELLPVAPRQTFRRLAQHFLSGDHRDVLFLANPRRTDLASLSPEAGRLLGHWEWPTALRPFLGGARPNAVELFVIRAPRFFASNGWLLSLESGRINDPPSDPSRIAYLKIMKEPAFLLVAGIPVQDNARCRLAIGIPDILTDHAPCSDPLLRGYRVPERSAAEGYHQLRVTTLRGNQPTKARFVLNGLDYGPGSEAGFVHGEGWFFPEKDERSRSFRWTSPVARSLLHIPEGGARLVIEGTAPLKYLGPGLTMALTEGGSSLATARITDGTFRVVVELKGEDGPFREVVLVADRGFVPHVAQKNGDLRRLALRVYSFRMEPLHGIP